MGWVIFICYIIYGLFINLMVANQNDARKDWEKAKVDHLSEKEIEEYRKSYRNISVAVDIMMWIGIASVGIFILYGLGWIWYFFCSGFLVFEDQPFWDKVICGLLSLIPLGFLIGIIMIICGWDPDK